MKTLMRFPACLPCVANGPNDTPPVCVSQITTFAALAGAPGDNDDGMTTPPRRRELRGRYAPGPIGPGLFRIHG